MTTTPFPISLTELFTKRFSKVYAMVPCARWVWWVRAAAGPGEREMSVSYSFEGNIIIMRLEGVYPPDAITEAFDRALADPGFPAENARLLMDVNRSESLADRPVEDLRRVAEHFAERADRVGNRCAIVAKSSVHFGLMRMAVVFAELREAEARVFKNEREATLWLNQDLPAGAE